MQRLSRILLEVNACDANRDGRAVGTFPNDEMTILGERTVVLLLGLGLLLLLAADLAQGFSTSKLSVLFMLSFWGPLLVLHELPQPGDVERADREEERGRNPD